MNMQKLKFEIGLGIIVFVFYTLIYINLPHELPYNLDLVFFVAVGFGVELVASALFDYNSAR
jgi:hypothetical protein